MIDTTTALEARANLVWVAEHWGQLRDRLHKTEGGALTGMPGVIAPSHQSAIDLDVSDLMFEIAEVTNWWAKALILSGWQPATLDMPGLLHGVASHYGHFTADNNEAVDFVDTAHEMRRKVTGLLFQKERRKYVGPCPQPRCQGELYAHDEENTTTCHECDTSIDRAEHEAWKHIEMSGVMMERPTMREALVTLGYHVPAETIRTWIDRGKLVPDGDGLFRLGDALELAQKRKGWQEVNAYHGT